MLGYVALRRSRAQPERRTFAWCAVTTWRPGNHWPANAVSREQRAGMRLLESDRRPPRKTNLARGGRLANVRSSKGGACSPRGTGGTFAALGHRVTWQHGAILRVRRHTPGASHGIADASHGVAAERRDLGLVDRCARFEVRSKMRGRSSDRPLRPPRTAHRGATRESISC